MSSGFLPLLGSAHADTCASWTDAKNDAKVNASAPEQLVDTNMDIVSTSLRTVGTSVVATIQVQDLLEGGYSDAGDRFLVQASVAGTPVKFVAERTELAEKGYLANAGGAVAGVATAVFDPTDNSVSITATLAEVDKAAGKATTGIAATDLVSATGDQANSQQIAAYDGSQAPTGTTFTFGAQCDTVVQPTTLVYPEGTCNDIADGPNDGTPTVVAPAAAPNEPTLDVTSVALNASADTIYAYIKVAGLAAKPANFGGERYEIDMKAGAKKYTFAAGRYDGAGHGVTAYPTRGSVDGTPKDAIKVHGVFDTAKNTVVIMADRAALDAANGAPITDGTQVTEVVVRTYGLQPALQFQADTAQATDVAARVWKIGGGKCFPAPAGVLANTGKTSVQYSDAAAVAAKLTTSAGSALAGKTVTFTVGGKSVNGTTNAAGIATASLNPGVAAGSYSLVAKFAGDSSAGAVTLTTPFKVVTEKTGLTFKVTKRGSKRTVVATLKDDDGHAVAGQAVTWYVNGKKLSTAKTNSAGAVTLSTAKPTQTVKAVYAGASGKYAGCTKTQKV